MAITRAQQAKQMLQNGGMLVQPGFGGTRQGYQWTRWLSRLEEKIQLQELQKRVLLKEAVAVQIAERGITQRGKGPKGTTGDIRGRDADPRTTTGR